MSLFEELGVQKEVPLCQGIVRYRECGSGEPIVFVHGLLVNGDVWRKVVPTLAQRYRCIIPDLPFGAHTLALNPDADLTPPGIARLLADFLTALDLAAVTLLASDTGGAFTQIVITEHPERVGRLVLTNCDAYENFLPLSLRAFEWLAFVPGWVSLLGYLCKHRFVQQLLLKLVAKYPIEDRATRSYMRSITTNKGVQHDVGKLLRGISTRYTTLAASKFGDFEKPVLLVWAREDFLFTTKYAQRLHHDFPCATLQYVKDSYAFVSEDQPEQLVQYIETFMSPPVLGH